MKTEQTLRVKGMVCYRCIFSITEVFQKLGFIIKDISLGKITFLSCNDVETKQAVEALGQLGFEVLEDKSTRRASQIKQVVHTYLKLSEQGEKRTKLSSYLQEQFPMSYEKISEVFSSSEGISIEKYVIQFRLDKVKEMLSYTTYSLTDIADLTGFSSVPHLVRQFKDHTGVTPGVFRVKYKKLNHVNQS